MNKGGVKQKAERLPLGSSASRIRSSARGVCSGFTLLEVILAVMILGAAMLAIMEGLAKSLNAVESIRNQNTAIELLSVKMADLEKLDTLEEQSQDGDFEEAHPGFTWNTDITSTEMQDLYEVHVTIFWKEHGQEASDSVTSYLYRPSEATRRLSEATRKPGQPAPKR